MINFDDATKENMKEHNLNWSQIPDHSQRILTVRAQDLKTQIHYLIY